MNPEYEYRQARKRVKQKKGFYQHLTSYGIVIGFLFIINMLTSPLDWWFYWPALGWGVELSIHWFAVFMRHSFFGKQWEERKIKEFMEEEQTDLTKRDRWE